MHARAVSSAILGIALVIWSTATFASHFVPIAPTRASFEYKLPAPHRWARIAVLNGDLRVWIDGRRVEIDARAFATIDGFDVNSVELARSSDSDYMLYLVFACTPSKDAGAAIDGYIMFAIKDFKMGGAYFDGCERA